MNTALKSLSRYGILFLAGILIMLTLLFLASLLPQEPINEHLRQSISLFEDEGNYAYIADQHESAVLDNHTEAMVLMESVSTNSTDFSRILSNPVFFEGTAADHLREFYETGGELKSYYVRYWMGFRLPVRILLCFLNYPEIRSLLAFVLFGLALACVFSIAKHINYQAAALFALSFILMKPHVIANSLHYSCDFLLAFIGVLTMPLAVQRKKTMPLMFILGMLTMFFDFYTSPVVVFGYPFIYMTLLDKNRKAVIKRTLYPLLSWLLGYALTWIAKLLLTSLFLPINGFEDGFSSFAMRVGIQKGEQFSQLYGLSSVYEALKRVLFSNNLLSGIIFVGIGLAVVLLLIKIVSNRGQLSVARTALPVLWPTLVVIVWYIVAAQPTAVHVYFQYRNVAVVIWSISQYYCLLYSAMRRKKEPSIMNLSEEREDHVQASD